MNLAISIQFRARTIATRMAQMMIMVTTGLVYLKLGPARKLVVLESLFFSYQSRTGGLYKWVVAEGGKKEQVFWGMESCKWHNAGEEGSPPVPFLALHGEPHLPLLSADAISQSCFSSWGGIPHQSHSQYVNDWWTGTWVMLSVRRGGPSSFCTREALADLAHVLDLLVCMYFCICSSGCWGCQANWFF